MAKTYLVNAFAINMVTKFPATIVIHQLDKEELCLKLEGKLEDGELINAVGHDGTIYIVNKLCGVNLEKNRVSIKTNKGDIALVITIAERLPEGKVLSEKELEDMYEQGKISFYEVII